MERIDVLNYKKVLIVGCGIMGGTIARILAEKNYHITILERRNHIAGNIYDYVDEHGIVVHKYGPHIVHTDSEEVYNFMQRFGNWQPFNVVCGAVIDGKCVPTAFNYKTIDTFYSKETADKLKWNIKQKFGERDSATVVELLECDDEVIRSYAQFLFEKDYSIYTAKQWGVNPSEIDPSVLKRVPIRFNYDEAYFKNKYQMMPAQNSSYTDFFRKLLDHPNIEVKLDTEALKHISIDEENNLLFDGKIVDFPIVYTGPVDELFNCRFGRLPYRSLRFEWKYEEKDSFQQLPVVAYPQAEGFTRITEYKKLPVQNVKGTTYAIEYPIAYNPEERTEPYYPVLTKYSQEMYIKYAELAESVKHLYLCGRLADFKYYDMDKAVLRAFEVCKGI